MRILVIGNQGYVGPVVTKHLHERKVGVIDGLDIGYFANCLTDYSRFAEYGISTQHYKDVRDVNLDDLSGYDGHLFSSCL